MDFVVLADFNGQGPGGPLRFSAGEVISARHFDIAALRAAGVALVEFRPDTMQPILDAYGNTGRRSTRGSGGGASSLAWALFSAAALPNPLAGPARGSLVSLTGPGPVDLSPSNTYNYNTSGGAFTARMPGHEDNEAAGVVVDGDEVWFIEVGGPPGASSPMNALTLDAGASSVISLPYAAEGIAASVVTRSRGVMYGYKFGVDGGGPGVDVWLRIDWVEGTAMVPNGALGAMGSPHVLAHGNVHKYDGSVVQQLSFDPAPVLGTRMRILEVQGGTANVTIDGNGNNLVDDAGASVASTVLSTARAYREWTFDGTIWLQTGTTAVVVPP